MFKSQNQDAGAGSTAIQAGGDVSITGLTYSEVRQVAIDVFRSNFYELVGVAKATASARAEEVTNAFLEKMSKENPHGIQKANDPDFQYALFTVQREYARTGDKDLGDLLVDLLVDRSKEDNRNILQIVLNESLAVAPKLTEQHLAALSIVFLFTRVGIMELGNDVSLGNYLDQFAAPFATKLSKNPVGFQHLEFCGCGKSGFGGQNLASVLRRGAQGFFQHGFEFRDLSDRAIRTTDQHIYVHNVKNPTLIQIHAVNKERLHEKFERHNVPFEDREKILTLFDQTTMSEAEVKDKCIEIRPYMLDIFNVWDNSQMNGFSLTSVGVAIAHGNIKRFTGPFNDLSVWIN